MWLSDKKFALKFKFEKIYFSLSLVVCCVFGNRPTAYVSRLHETFHNWKIAFAAALKLNQILV